VKILYASQYFPPEMGAHAARAAELASHWTRAGHEVTVLTGFPNHPTGVVPSEYRGKLRRLVMRESVDGINVIRAWLLPFPNRKAYERMLNYSSFCVSAAVAGMFVSRPDVLIATSPQLLVGLSGWWLARLKRVPFIFEVRDLWPESLAAVGMGDSNSLLHRGLAKLAGFLYRRSQHIVVVTPAFKNHLVQNWQLAPEKISVVENGVETELFSPTNADDLRLQLGLKGKFVVSYIGTMGMAHGLDALIEVATQLQTTDPKIVFLMVGEGADKERIVRMAGERNLTNIRFVDQQPREKVPQYIAASDACLVLLKKTELFKTVIPTKMLEFMACARPVVLGVDGQARQIMHEAGAGVFVEPENVSALIGGIRHLAANPALRESMGRSGRHYIVENYSRQRSAATYVTLLQNLLHHPEARSKAVAEI
jgi:colanic acid biosynthesis glycosyl transferase WcaI